jgi:hypothetical protein
MPFNYVEYTRSLTLGQCLADAQESPGLSPNASTQRTVTQIDPDQPVSAQLVFHSSLVMLFSPGNIHVLHAFLHACPAQVLYNGFVMTGGTPDAFTLNAQL